jgi:hypothetical protein
MVGPSVDRLMDEKATGRKDGRPAGKPDHQAADRRQARAAELGRTAASATFINRRT